MPIYEYECQKCKAHMEVMQKISDAPKKKCPQCGGKLEKQWSNTSFQLKGSGWYVTDYAKSAGKGGDKETVSGEKQTAAKTDDDGGESSSKNAAAPSAEAKADNISDAKKSAKASDAKKSSSKPAAKPKAKT